MDHLEAVRIYAAERYLLEELSEAEQGQYETHFATCCECSEELQATAAFFANARAVLKRPVAMPPAARHPLAARSRWRAWFVPIPVGTAAAMALLAGGLLFTSWSAPGDGRTVPLAARDQSRHTLKRARGEAVALSSPADLLVLTLSKAFDREYPSYQWQLENGKGEVLLSQQVDAPESDRELQIVLDGLSDPGPYAIVLRGLDEHGNPGSKPARYFFEVVVKEGKP